jgi:hypothetical protein
MKISKTHRRFADLLGNQRSLSHPNEFLGPNWEDVLNFWLYLDTLSEEQFNVARSTYWNLGVDDRISIQNLAQNAACVVTGKHISQSADLATPGYAGGVAARELIGSHKILEQGKELKIVQLFLEL